MLIHSFLEKSALRLPDKIALVHEEKIVKYFELNAFANGIAMQLIETGVSVGDRVPILWENSYEFVASYYGILKAGAVAVPLNPQSKSDSLKPIFLDIQPVAIICSSPSVAEVSPVMPGSAKTVLIERTDDSGAFKNVHTCLLEDIRSTSDECNFHKDIKPNQLANIIYTSGSTGEPKGVMLTHANIVANTRSICEYLKISAQDIQMVVLPFFYVMGLSLLNTHFAAGGRVVLNNRFAFAAKVLNQMASEHVTAFSGVPSTYAFLLHRSPIREFKERLTDLRYCSQAGGHMPTAVKKELRKVLPVHTDIVIMYGATEASARLTYLEPARFEDKIGSIGKAIPGVTIGILDNNGSELSPMQEGELVARGENIMKGYWNDPEATQKVMDRHGYHTGDLGYCDQEGYLFITGRKDAIVKIAGHRVNPQEIEDALMETGLLVETAVIAVPDDLLGNRLVAIGAAHNPATTKEMVLKTCAGMLPRHKVPSSLIFTRMLPKNANGKIDRTRCFELIPKVG